ncbi:DUF1127 domain-containing protein [Microvirga puerhi]|uniref:DUF1127 domain-containing protein n=1 Tax=Microvirga puerhi TaxID=2876078 RepID=A0ABS7VP57_9HYPH|nr:DUF1127 domain-containing protein [Microvirga puerhi]MBZ6076733.1 DUF1127 domain-containing protein [Microvirga puerhi]
MSQTLTRTAAFAPNSTSRPSLLSGIVAFIAREIRIRRDMRQLSAFGDSALHDIGLVRSNIEDVVRHGRPTLIVPTHPVTLAPAEHEENVSPTSLTEWR